MQLRPPSRLFYLNTISLLVIGLFVYYWLRPNSPKGPSRFIGHPTEKQIDSIAKVELDAADQEEDDDDDELYESIESAYCLPCDSMLRLEVSEYTQHFDSIVKDSEEEYARDVPLIQYAKCLHERNIQHAEELNLTHKEIIDSLSAWLGVIIEDYHYAIGDDYSDIASGHGYINVEQYLATLIDTMQRGDTILEHLSDFVNLRQSVRNYVGTSRKVVTEHFSTMRSGAAGYYLALLNRFELESNRRLTKIEMLCAQLPPNVAITLARGLYNLLRNAQREYIEET